MSLVLVVLFLHAGLQSGGEPYQEDFADLPTIARKALHAQTSLRYTGTRIVQYRRGPDIDKHTEYVTRDGLLVRIEFPPGSKFTGQVIVENSQERRHFFPSRNEIHVTPPRPETVFEWVRGWHDVRHPTFSEESGDRIAGFATRVVIISDANGNPMEKVFIEPRSGAVLGRRFFDQVGTESSFSQFTAINFHPEIDRSVFSLRHKGARITTPVDNLMEECKKGGFDPVVLAKSTGFRLDSAHSRIIDGENVLICSYYSPKGRVVIFELAVGVDPKKFGDRAVRATTVKVGSHWYALLGPLDSQTLNSLANSLGSGTGR